ncbi:MAG: hypothetical protein PHF74_01150 [Dehalococcoidales bacterium]|nr:hypothetical protein [Dehalococcoidales bacterium]
MLKDSSLTRQEMIYYLDDRMNKTYSQLYETQELEPDTSLIKTYLLEAHLNENASYETLQEFLYSISQGYLRQKHNLKIESSYDDPTLFQLTAFYNKEAIKIFLDASNPRFWILHSTNMSISLDWFIDRLIKEHQHIDRTWFWPEILYRLSKKGVFKGLGLDYDYRPIVDENSELTNSVEYLKMQLWGTAAKDVYNILNEQFPFSTTLSKVKIKHWLSSQESNDFTIDDFKYDGKVTARGTSFMSHLSLISNTYTEYISTIHNIEQNYSIKVNSINENVNIGGKALNFYFPKPIDNLDRFCNRLFSASLPFRLWGCPIKLGEYVYRVTAIDLHVNCRIDFEITPEFMRVYLPYSSCGNTVVRLYTNLKHHFNSQITFKEEGSDGIF